MDNLIVSDTNISRTYTDQGEDANSIDCISTDSCNQLSIDGNNVLLVYIEANEINALTEIYCPLYKQNNYTYDRSHHPNGYTHNTSVHYQYPSSLVTVTIADDKQYIINSHQSPSITHPHNIVPRTSNTYFDASICIGIVGLIAFLWQIIGCATDLCQSCGRKYTASHKTGNSTIIVKVLHQPNIGIQNLNDYQQQYYALYYQQQQQQEQKKYSNMCIKLYGYLHLKIYSTLKIYWNLNGIIVNIKWNNINISQQQQQCNHNMNNNHISIPINNINLLDYTLWECHDVYQWLMNIQNGYFKQYYALLLNNLKLENNGSCIKCLYTTDIHRIGITDYKDKHIMNKLWICVSETIRL